MPHAPQTFRLAALALAALLPSAAFAQPYGGAPQVTLASAVFVERTESPHGIPVRALEPAERLARGDRVVTLLTWYRLGGRGGFTVTNPLPARLLWQGSADQREEVSVDGGRTWGRLDSLRVNGRPATRADITHVRWHVSEDDAETGSGTITYAGLVR